MISGLVLKYLNGKCFVIRQAYETTLLASTEFNLTVPALRILKAVAEEYGKVLTLDAVDEVDVWSIDELVRYGLISVRQLHNADELTLTNEGEWYLENLLGE
jgi:hypothetical protein